MQVVANLRVYKTDAGAIDAERTTEPVASLIAAGATDLRVRFPVREPNTETENDLRAFVAAFRAAAERS